MLQAGAVDFVSHSEDQTRRLGKKLASLVQAGQVIALLGNLGAGKTRFAQGFALGLGLAKDEIVNSPTFTFINEYPARLSLYHIDLYRLDEALEAETLGIDDYLYGNGVCLVEWADRLGDMLPDDYLEIKLSYVSETKRRIELRAYGKESTALLTRFQNLVFGV